MAQLHESVKRGVAELGNSIGQPTETSQRSELLGLVGLFCLQQYLHAHTFKESRYVLWANGIT